MRWVERTRPWKHACWALIFLLPYSQPMTLDRRIIINVKDMEYKPLRPATGIKKVILNWLTGTYRKKVSLDENRNLMTWKRRWSFLHLCYASRLQNGRRDASEDFDSQALSTSLPRSRDVDGDLVSSLLQEQVTEMGKTCVKFWKTTRNFSSCYLLF